MFNSLATRVDAVGAPAAQGRSAASRARCWSSSPPTAACAAASTPTSSRPPRSTSPTIRPSRAARWRWRWSAARAATSSSAAASTCSTRKSGLFQNVKWAHAQAIANTCIKEFLGPDVELGLPGLQRVPVGDLAARGHRAAAADSEASGAAGAPGDGPDVQGADYLFEPSPAELLDTLLPFHVAVQVNRALLESSAAEHAARMTAMDAATRNAKEMVDRLTLYMNKVRQAAITREIIEIVSGAQAT